MVATSDLPVGLKRGKVDLNPAPFFL
jgi:hypothetical protein